MPDNSKETLQAIRCAADIIRANRRGVVLTGAGISTPSGIPDFRSANSGLWEHYDPFEVVSLESFRYRPQNFFKWIHPLVKKIAAAQPNPAHIGLAQLEIGGFLDTLITQNIDNLHERAGSKNVLEVHGTLRTLTCTGCFRQYESSQFMSAYLEDCQIPICMECTHILKPDIILYGEQLPVKTWLKAKEACKSCHLMIVAGSSLEVLPVAGLPMRALENGAHLIIINQSETYLDVRADVVFHDDVADIIPRIVAEVL